MSPADKMPTISCKKYHYKQHHKTLDFISYLFNYYLKR